MWHSRTNFIWLAARLDVAMEIVRITERGLHVQKLIFTVFHLFPLCSEHDKNVYFQLCCGDRADFIVHNFASSNNWKWCFLIYETETLSTTILHRCLQFIVPKWSRCMWLDFSYIFSVFFSSSKLEITNEHTGIDSFYGSIKIFLAAFLPLDVVEFAWDCLDFVQDMHDKAS